METSSESTTCLICFKITARQIFVPADASGDILNNCKTYLHSTLTKQTLKDVQLKNQNSMPLCKSCFDSALELTQLSEQLATLQKEISDLTVTFSLEVFHRRSLVYNTRMQNNSQNVHQESVIELNVSCLPANTFLTKDVHQNIQQFNDKSNRNVIIDNHPNDTTEIANANVKNESSEFEFDNFPIPINFQKIYASDDAETLLNKESQDKNCNQPTLKNPTNLTPQSEVKTIQINAENESVGSSNNFKNKRQLTMSDLIKSIQMPQVKLKRIKLTSLKVNTSNVNLFKKKSEPRHSVLNKSTCKDIDFSMSNCVSNNSVVRKQFKCFYCEMTFHRSSHRSLHHRTHTGEKPYKCSFCKKTFTQSGTLKRHQRNHTGGKPLQCSFCEKRFNDNWSLHNHERTHTAEKPFKCSFCPKHFNLKRSLQNHEKSHQGNSVEDESTNECFIVGI